MIVQSYADMVSEQSSQADDLTFGSPNYPTNGSLKDTTIVEENSMENSSEKKNTDSGNEDVGGRGYRDPNYTMLFVCAVRYLCSQTRYKRCL